MLSCGFNPVMRSLMIPSPSITRCWRGRISGFSVADNGTILGRYSNGQSRTLGEVVLANFANPQGLQPLGGNGFAETSVSGQPLVGGPGTGALATTNSVTGTTFTKWPSRSPGSRSHCPAANR